MVRVFVTLLCAGALFGCKPQEVNSAGQSIGQSDPNAASLEVKTPAPEPVKDVPYQIPYPDRKPKPGDEVAVFDTDKGKIVFMFFPDKAPKHVAQMKKLIGMGFYDGTRFHRCIAGFMVQGGDPNSKEMAKSGSWGMGGYKVDGKEVNIPHEFTDIKHKRGVMSAARSNDPDSASSQFFIMTNDTSSLDGQYSAWGQVLEGMGAVDQIVGTGDAANNGAVAPDKAIVLKKATLQKWPLK